ncbi:MAG TPA: ABC transporter permease subunit [Candidatus Dormibacteraeota bacterium]|nr:ABC transporter permease subunit [Candidatus Dormibacteraeota bacterium]
MAPAGGGKPPRRKRRRARSTKGPGEQPLSTAETAAPAADESGAQNTEPPQARAAAEASTSRLTARQSEEAATEAAADESGPELPGQGREPSAQGAAAEAKEELAEVEAGVERAAPAATEAEAGEPVLEAPAQEGEQPAQGAAPPEAEVPGVEAEAGGPEPVEVEAGADSPQPVPEPESTAIPPVAAAIARGEGGPVSLEAPGPAPRGLYELLWGTGLLNVAAIGQKDLSALFRWPIAYVAWALVIVLTSIFGYLPQVNTGAPVSMSGIFNWLALLMAFFVPLCTMRLLAEEQRSGSIEMLLTSPVRFWEVVLGKWLGGFLFYTITITFTLVYVILISAYQQPHAPATIFGVRVSLPSVDYGSVVTGYVGILLVGAAWVALGVLASSLTRNQIVAVAVGAAGLIALEYGLGALAGFVTSPLSDLFDYLAASSRAQSFNQGQMVLRDLIYFATLTLGALFVTSRVVGSRRWR